MRTNSENAQTPQTAITGKSGISRLGQSPLSETLPLTGSVIWFLWHGESHATSARRAPRNFLAYSLPFVRYETEIQRGKTPVLWCYNDPTVRICRWSKTKGAAWKGNWCAGLCCSPQRQPPTTASGYPQSPVKVWRSPSELCSLRQRRVEHTKLPAKQEQTLQSILKNVPWPQGKREKTAIYIMC